MVTLEGTDRETLEVGIEPMIRTDMERVEFALQSDNPGVLAAGKYLRAHNRIQDQEQESSINPLSFTRRIVERIAEKRLRDAFIATTGAEMRDDISHDDAAPFLARYWIDDAHLHAQQLKN